MDKDGIQVVIIGFNPSTGIRAVLTYKNCNASLNPRESFNPSTGIRAVLTNMVVQFNGQPEC